MQRCPAPRPQRHSSPGNATGIPQSKMLHPHHPVHSTSGSPCPAPRHSWSSGGGAGGSAPSESSSLPTRRSVQAASLSNDSADALPPPPGWSKTKTAALSSPMRGVEELWHQLLLLLGLASHASEYGSRFIIYKAREEQHQHELLSKTASHASTATSAAAAAPAEASSSAVWTDFNRIRGLALPLMAQNVFEYLMTVICTISIGRLGAAELAASSLANSVYIVTGLSMALGLSSAMETLCGQAYGAKEYKALGEVLQRALLVCWAACIPVGLLWTHSEALMLAVGQTPEVAALAGRYLGLCIPCIFLNIGTDCMKKYLQAQHIVSPGMFANAASTFLAPVYFYYMVSKLGLGLDGAAFAFILCQLTSFVGLVAYIAWHSRQNAGSKTATWGGFSPAAAFSKWGQYLQYGIPAMMMISLEWWVYQIPIVMIGWLPNAEAALSVGGICVAFNGWAYMVALGLSQAVNTCVSNALGAGDAAGARRATAIGVVSMLALETALVCGVLTFGEQLVRLIATDPAVVALAVKTLPVLCGVMFMDGLNTILYGVVRGTGEQATGSLISGGYLAVATALTYGINFGLPPGVVESLPLLGSLEPVARIWMGVVLGAMCQFSVLFQYISKWDWEAQAAQAKARSSSIAGTATSH